MGTSEERPLRILAADDSAVMRSILWKLFLLQKEDRSSELPRMELVRDRARWGGVPGAGETASPRRRLCWTLRCRG